MAKRKAKAATRKAARRKKKTATRRVSRPSARKGAARKAVRSKARATARKRTTRRKAAPTRSKKASVAKKVSVAKKASVTRRAPATKKAAPTALQRERRQLREDETVPGAPSTLGYSPKASGAESGQAMYRQRKREHTEGGPALTAGDLDADWNEAYSSGEETPGGDMPTPDQDVVDEIGRALGVEYEDAEELKGSEKIEKRDKHRWEYDPASAEDYKDRNKK